MVFHDLLLEGKPGTGKTLFAETLAIEAKFDFVFIDGPRWSQLPVQEALQSLYDLMDIAKNNKRPVLLFIDEADAVFQKDKQGQGLKIFFKIIN